MSPFRVVVADDHPVVLAGIKSLISAAPQLDVIGEATSGLAGLRVVKDSAPDVAVIDISMPDMNGIALARRLAQECPSVKVIALTVHEDRAYVQQLLEAGARGYVLKRSAPEDLVRAIHAVLADGIYVDPTVAAKMLRVENAGVSMTGQLSERETDVLRFAARGHSNKEIAARLDLSIKTVETYKARASEKLCLRTRAEIVRYGAAQGWLDEP